jgi:tetratricopeptide (TPR) repeat protein
VTLLPGPAGRDAAAALRKAAGDPDPMVRRAAAESLPMLDAAQQLELGMTLLADPMRTVRLEAVGSVLDIPRTAMTSAQIAALDNAVAEYRQVQTFNADRAEGQVNLGMLETRLGNFDAAEQALATAARIQPSFTPAYVNLADLQRRRGREADAEATLRRGLLVAPRDATLHEALGLSLVRQQRVRDALPELAKAAELAPQSPRYAYVYAIALNDSGDPRAAIDVLKAAHERHPASQEIVVALIDYENRAGNLAAAAQWAKRLADITGDPEVRRLAAEMERANQP